MAAAPSHVGQSSVAGTADSGGGPCNSVGNVPGPVEKCASVTSPIAPDQTISAATRLHSCEKPWLPICVATLYLAAASISRRASHGVRVSGDRKSTRLNSSHLGISYAV